MRQCQLAFGKGQLALVQEGLRVLGQCLLQGLELQACGRQVTPGQLQRDQRPMRCRVKRAQRNSLPVGLVNRLGRGLVPIQQVALKQPGVGTAGLAGQQLIDCLQGPGGIAVDRRHPGRQQHCGLMTGHRAQGLRQLLTRGRPVAQRGMGLGQHRAQGRRGLGLGQGQHAELVDHRLRLAGRQQGAGLQRRHIRQGLAQRQGAVEFDLGCGHLAVVQQGGAQHPARPGQHRFFLDHRLEQQDGPGAVLLVGQAAGLGQAVGRRRAASAQG